MSTMSKNEFIEKRPAIHQAQIALESAYSSLKRSTQWEKITGEAAARTPEALRNRIYQARRRVRREYQRAVRTYDERTQKQSAREGKLCQQ